VWAKYSAKVELGIDEPPLAQHTQHLVSLQVLPHMFLVETLPPFFAFLAWWNISCMMEKNNTIGIPQVINMESCPNITFSINYLEQVVFHCLNPSICKISSWTFD
jgi:hypothetical protein